MTMFFKLQADVEDLKLQRQNYTKLLQDLNDKQTHYPDVCERSKIQDADI